MKNDEFHHASPAPVRTRREFLRGGSGLVLVSAATLLRELRGEAGVLDISSRYSPKDSRRPARPHTDYIVLHTTEGAEEGSLKKILRYGEAHYFVTLAGRVYRIIEKSKIATHAGRSMWNGKRTIDNYSIGVEVVGYHNKDINREQYVALKELLRQLMSLYRISPQSVVTHSMVAYGRPNRFHSENHRGRKRCGMIFARPDVREELGIGDKPIGDRDVEAGRLVVADPELFQFLFTKAPSPAASVALRANGAASAGGSGPSPANTIDKGRTAWYIARERYNHTDTVYVFPNGTRVPGDRIRDWSNIPVGTQVLLPEEPGEGQGFEGFLEIGKDGDTAWALAGESFNTRTTIYFFPDGFIRTGHELARSRSTRRLLDNLPPGTRLLVGYVYGGHATTRRPPASIAGHKWNYPSTYYRFPDGKIVSGDEIDAGSIPPRTLVFYQN